MPLYFAEPVMPGHILNLVIPWTSFYTVHKYSSCLVDRIVFSRHRIFFSLFRWNYLQWWTLGLFIANMQILVSTSDSDFEFSKVGLDILYHKNRFLENLIEKKHMSYHNSSFFSLRQIYNAQERERYYNIHTSSNEVICL